MKYLFLFILLSTFCLAAPYVLVGNQQNRIIIDYINVTNYLNSSNTTEYWLTAEGVLNNAADLKTSWLNNDAGFITSYSDTNETPRVNNLVNLDCSGTDKVTGFYLNGTPICGTDLSTAAQFVQGDGIYLYNDTGSLETITLNDTKLNSTINNRIDLRVTSGFLKLIGFNLTSELANLFQTIADYYSNAQIDTLVNNNLTSAKTYTDLEINNNKTTLVSYIDLNILNNQTNKLTNSSDTNFTGVIISTLLNCDTINTTETGELICGTDNSGDNATWNEELAFTRFLNRTSENIYLSTYNLTYVNNNLTMKSYVDIQDNAQDECSEITNCVVGAITSETDSQAKGTMAANESAWLFTGNATYTANNNSMMSYITLNNNSMKSYVDANSGDNTSWNEELAFTRFLNRTSENIYLSTYNLTYVNNNLTMKSYVDTQDNAQDECSEITNCVVGAITSETDSQAKGTMSANESAWLFTGNATYTANNESLRGYADLNATAQLELINANNASNLNISWDRLTNYPSGCPAGTFLTNLSDTAICAIPTSPTSDVAFNSVTTNNVTMNNTGLFYNQEKLYARTADVVVCRGQNATDDIKKLAECDVVCLSTDNDCSDDINTAINATRDVGGGIVEFSCGNYYNLNQIVLQNKTYLKGSGDCTNFILNNTNTALESVLGTDKKMVYFTGFEDLSLWSISNGTVTPNTGFNLACQDCYFRNIKSNYNNFIAAREGKISQNVFGENLRVNSGLNFDGTNMSFPLGGLDGIINMVGNNIKIINLHATAYSLNFSGGIVVNPSTSGCVYSSNIEIDGLTVDGPYGSLIHAYAHSCGEINPIPQYTFKRIVYQERSPGNYEHFAIFLFLPSITAGSYALADFGKFTFEDVTINLADSTALFNLQLTNASIPRRLIVEARDFHVNGTDVIFFYPNMNFKMSDSTITPQYNTTAYYIGRFGAGMYDDTHTFELDNVRINTPSSGKMLIEGIWNTSGAINDIRLNDVFLSNNGIVEVYNYGQVVLPIHTSGRITLVKHAAQEEYIKEYAEFNNIQRNGYIYPMPQGVPEGNIIGLFNGDNNTVDWSVAAANNSASVNVSFSEGVFGQAFLFNGSQPSNQILFSNAPLHNVSGTAEWGACAWVNPASRGSNMGVLRKESNYLLYVHSSGVVWARIWNASGTAKEDTDGLIPLNEWSFICGTANSTAVSVWLNAHQYVNPTAYSGSIQSTTNNLQIGGNGAGDKFNGSIDQIMIFNKALSQSEVNALFEQTRPIQPYGNYYSKNSDINPIYNLLRNIGSSSLSWLKLWVQDIDASGDINATSNTPTDCGWEGNFTLGAICANGKFVAGVNDTDQKMYCCEI